MKILEEFSQEEKQLLEPFVSNVDKNVFVLRNLPEVIKGALFSRYSRSSKGLRRLLLDEFILNAEGSFKEIVGYAEASGIKQSLAIQKAQDFYDRILDGYGDDSIGELGGAHLAIENISNIGTKIIQDSRIGGSPLEKSTRYIVFDKKVDGDYLFYKEPKIMESDLAETYLEVNRSLFDTYASLVEPMKKFFIEQTPKEEGTPDIAYNFSIRARACDALRGFLPCSTLTNMGVFGNGRFFEGIIRKLRLNELQEMNNLGEEIHEELNSSIPSFVRRSSPEHKHFEPFRKFLNESRDGIKKFTKEIVSGKAIEKTETVNLVDYDKNAEEKVLTALMYKNSRLSYEQLREIVRSMKVEKKNELLDQALSRRTNRRHKPNRAFEHAYYTFDILTDFGSYRDLHRHRMLTQERQDLTVAHGYDVPLEITEAGFEKKFMEMMKLAADAYYEIYKKFPKESQYIVPFAYKIRWHVKINLRSLYWLTELRSGQQGHPTYRYVAQQMALKVKEVHPSLTKYMKFVDMQDYSLGRLEAEKKKIQNNTHKKSFL